MKHVINVATEWSKLFKVKCLHDFYSDDICKDLIFKPTDQTLRDMRNLRLVYREQAGGFIVLCKKTSTLPLLKNRYSGLKKLSFFLDVKGENFYNYSDIPFSSFEKIHYISNSADRKKAKEGVYIHKQEHLDLDEANRLGIRPKFFSINLEKPIKKFSPVLKDSFDDTVSQTEYSMSINEDNTKVYVDLRNLNEGRYDLSIGSWTSKFYLMDNFADFHWGILEIYLKEVGSDVELFNDKEITGKNFFFRIKPRETYWKYIFVEKENEFKEGDITDVKISKDGDELEFSKPQSHQLVNGREAVYVESKKPLALEEVRSTKDKLEMRLKRGKKWMTKVVRAPKPQNEMLKPDKNNGKIYSVIYVNI